MLPPPSLPAAGWFPDPWTAGHLRYWDGGSWTPHIHRVEPAVEPTLPLRAGMVGLGVLLGGFALSIAVGVTLYLLRLPDAVVVAGSAAGLYGLLVWYCRRVSRRYGTGRLGPDLGLQLRWIDLATGLGTWFAAAVAQVVIAVALQALGLPIGSNTDEISDSTDEISLLLTLAVVAIVVAPIVEELFFRGLLLRSLESRLVPWLAIVVQGLLFGVIHLQIGLGWGNVSLALALAAVGMVFGVAAHRAGRLGPAIVGHALVNSIAVLAVWLMST